MPRQNNTYKIGLKNGTSIHIKASNEREAHNRVYLLGDDVDTIQREFKSGRKTVGRIKKI